MQWSTLNPLFTAAVKSRSVFDRSEAEHLFSLINTHYFAVWLVCADLEYRAATRQDDEMVFRMDEIYKTRAPPTNN